MVQVLTIHLPMQAPTPVWEDSAYCGASQPVHYCDWVYTLEDRSHDYWSPQAREPMLCDKRSTTVKSLCTAMRVKSPFATTKESPRAMETQGRNLLKKLINSKPKTNKKKSWCKNKMGQCRKVWALAYTFQIIFHFSILATRMLCFILRVPWTSRRSN